MVATALTELQAVAVCRHLLPVLVEIQYGQIVAEGGGQPFPFQGVLMQHDVAGVAAFLQEHHRPAVVGSGSPRHHRQLPLIGQTLA